MQVCRSHDQYNLVMGLIFVLYKDAYAKAIGTAGDAVLGIIGGVISFNGVIEAIVVL